VVPAHGRVNPFAGPLSTPADEIDAQKTAAVQINSDHEPNILRIRALSAIRLHDLRHTHATLLLASGEQLKVVPE
jgi:integrase